MIASYPLPFSDPYGVCAFLHDGLVHVYAGDKIGRLQYRAFSELGALVDEREDGGRDVPYFKQAEGTGNFVIGYDKDQWDVRLAFNYRDSYLDELGDTALQDRYTDAYTNADLTAKYEFSDQLTIRGAVLNLLDSPEYYYFGNAARLSQYDEYGVSYELGFSYKF
jgi:outer membrane receptor protein involved in Fe transport